MADILSDAIACIGFTWIASPACTELEMVMMNWLGKMLDLPDQFLFSEGATYFPSLSVTDEIFQERWEYYLCFS